MRALHAWLAGVLLLASCTPASDLRDPYGERESRTYCVDYSSVVEETAEAIVAVGLGIESAAAEGDSTYVITATRKERFGRNGPITVSRVHVYVVRLSTARARVRVETEKITRTSMVGQSSNQRPEYARRIFKQLERRFPKAPEEGNVRSL